MIKLNGIEIKPTIFPDKTSQVWKLDVPLENFPFGNKIEWDFENEAEFLHVAQLVDLLKSYKNWGYVFLHIPFFPFARQDKEISNTTTFAKSTFVKLLKNLEFFEITTLDIHSLGDFRSLPQLKNITPEEYIQSAIRAVEPTVILYPDKGAKERYEYMLEGLEFVYCEKIRDQLSGEIIGLKLKDQILTTDRALIVDDICDGGRTFIEVAKILKEQGVNEISLYTTHGIYSKGTQVLRDAGIKRIFNYKGEVLT